MIKFIRFEIIRNLRRKRVRVLTLLLILCEFITLAALNDKSKNEDVFSLSDGSTTVSVMTRTTLSDEDTQFIEKQVEKVNVKGSFFDYYKNTKQWKKMYLTGMEVYCYQVDTRTSIPIESQSTFDYTNHVEELKKIQKEYNLTSVPKNPKGTTWFQPIGTVGYEMIPFYQQGTRYFERLYKNNLNPLCYSSVDSSTVLIQLVRNVFNVLLPVLIVLLFFDLKKSYKDSGVDKSLMVIPNLKDKFYLYEYVANFILIALIVLIPVLLISIALGIKNGFQNFLYPILCNTKGIFGFEFSKINNFTYDTQWCIQNNAMYNYGLTYLSTEMARNPYLDFTSLWCVVVLTILMMILLIGVYYQLSFIISYLFKNSYFGLFFLLLLLLILCLLSPLGSSNMLNMINPITYRDPTMIITGTSCFPYSIGMIVLFSYNLILYALGKFIFKKKFY